jgi:hypothetical protein
MKYLLILLGAWCVAVGTLLWVHRPRGPQIVFPEGTEYDFGTIDVGQSVSHAFRFENRGREVLRIGRTVSGCSCAGTRVDQAVLEPGQSSTVHVYYQGRPAVHEQEFIQVALASNDPKRPWTKLLLSGAVRQPVFWYPASASFFTQRGEGRMQREIRFKAGAAVTGLEVLHVTTSSERITARWEKDTSGGRCIIELNPNCPEGNWTDYITMQITVEGSERDVQIPVYLMVHA